MEPVSAGIMAGLSLFQGLMSSAAARKQKQDELTYEGIKRGLDTQMKGAEQLSAGTQNSVQAMIQQYRGILG